MRWITSFWSEKKINYNFIDCLCFYKSVYVYCSLYLFCFILQAVSTDLSTTSSYRIYSCISRPPIFKLKIGFFIIVKEVKFRQIEISQKLIWEISSGNVLKTKGIKSTCLYHQDLSTHEHFDLLEKYFTMFCKSHWKWNLLPLTNLYLNVEFERRLSKPKEQRITSKDRAYLARLREKTAFASLLSYCDRSMKLKVRHCKQRRSCKKKGLFYSPEDTI